MAKEYTEHYNLEQDDENEFYDVAVQNRNMDNLDSIIYALGQAVAEKLQSSAYTAEDVLAKLKTVDGVGSGLDADLLDGRQATDFLLTSTYTALDVFNKVKAQDGAGSGLDADLFQGKTPGEFIDPFIAHLVDFIAQPANGGLTTGSSISYICTSDPPPGELKDRIGVVITAHTASGANPTLNWNGLGAKPIKKANGNPAKLSANGIYTLRYSISEQSFILQGEGAEVDADMLDGKRSTEYQSRIVRQNITIPNTGWVSNTGDYEYKKNVTLEGVTSNSWVDLAIDADYQDIASDAGVSPSLTEYNGGFTLYASSIPSGDLVGKVKVIK